jgi:hypothetical protein
MVANTAVKSAQSNVTNVTTWVIKPKTAFEKKGFAIRVSAKPNVKIKGGRYVTLRTAELSGR